MTDIRKKDLKNKIRVLGLFKGGLTCAFDTLAWRTGNDTWETYVHKTYMKFLQKKYWDTGLYKTNVIDEMTFGEIETSDKMNIWIFWYQGWENAPQIVKDCRVATEKYLDGETYNVHYLTKETASSFVKFPEWIMEKVEAGTITLTEFSNLLREALLYKFGGIWMDATLFLTEPLDEKITDWRYYTIKRPPDHPMYCISRHQWSTFFVTTNRCETPFYRELLTSNMEYWRRETGIFDYLILDYFMAMILRNHPDMAKEWEDIPQNNTESLFIERSMNKKFDPDTWEKIKKETGIFKLTYKIPLSDDPDTYYNRVVNTGGNFV